MGACGGVHVSVETAFAITFPWVGGPDLPGGDELGVGYAVQL